jgi:hypothetical protein
MARGLAQMFGPPFATITGPAKKMGDESKETTAFSADYPAK